MKFRAVGNVRWAALSKTVCHGPSRRAVALAILAMGLHLEPAHALDDGKFTVTVGAKEWVTDWTSWRPNSVFFEAGRIRVSESVHSSTQLTTTPQLSVRYGDFFVAAS